MNSFAYATLSGIHSNLNNYKHKMELGYYSSFMLWPDDMVFKRFFGTQGRCCRELLAAGQEEADCWSEV